MHVGHPDYLNAKKGMAVPYGGHNDPDAHNMGDYKSIYTSWSFSRNVADYHANKNGAGGVVLIKRFKLSQTVPSPDGMNEGEMLVPGVVKGAGVTTPLGRGNPTAW